MTKNCNPTAGFLSGDSFPAQAGERFLFPILSRHPCVHKTCKHSNRANRASGVVKILGNQRLMCIPIPHPRDHMKETAKVLFSKRGVCTSMFTGSVLCRISEPQVCSGSRETRTTWGCVKEGQGKISSPQFKTHTHTCPLLVHIT